MKRLLIWSTDISSVITGKGTVGGISVQLYFWARIFVKNGWEVASMTEGDPCEMEGIRFFHRTYRMHVDALLEWFLIMRFLFKFCPDVIMSRGSHRIVFPLALLCRLFGVKYVFFGASDVNFDPDDIRSLVGNKANRWLFHKGLSICKYIVAQNQYQYNSIRKNYGKESLLLPNIWITEKQTYEHTDLLVDVIWVANLRPLKRPEWVLDAAKALVKVQFMMVGGSGNEDYFLKIKEIVDSIPNIDFLGPQSFQKTSELISHSKILICTSEFEGFPNTFLQAWANNIPVISTVDPSGVIDRYHLGTVVKDKALFQETILTLLNDEKRYSEIQENITAYFNLTHNSQINYEKLLHFIR